MHAVGLGNKAQNMTSWVLQCSSGWEFASGSTEVQEAEWGARMTGPHSPHLSLRLGVERGRAGLTRSLWAGLKLGRGRALPLDSHMTSGKSLNLFYTGGIIILTQLTFQGGYWEE